MEKTKLFINYRPISFLGVPEQDGENCVKLAEKLLLDKFHVGGSPIENAHRTGKAVQ